MTRKQGVVFFSFTSTVALERVIYFSQIHFLLLWPNLPSIKVPFSVFLVHRLYCPRLGSVSPPPLWLRVTTFTATFPYNPTAPSQYWLRPWRHRQHVPSKCLYPLARIHCVTTKKTAIWVIGGVKTITFPAKRWYPPTRPQYDVKTQNTSRIFTAVRNSDLILWGKPLRVGIGTVCSWPDCWISHVLQSAW